MSSSGAIPKIKGGARPKTKVISNGDYGNKQTEKLNNISANTKPTDASNFTHKKCNVSSEKRFHKQIGSNNCTDESSLASFSDIRIGNSKPLDVREILITDEGVQIKRRALSPDWVEKRIFIHYTRPPVCNMDGDYVIGAVDAWVEQMEFLVGDLSWLLCLPHHRFWSQVVFDKSVEECLHFYLMLGPRWYDKLPDDESCLAVINSIHQLTFLVYVRMATFKESTEDHITPSAFGDLIYNNFLYDICKILDLCVLYGNSNRPLLQKIVSNIFTYQPKYFQDLSELALTLFSVLKNVEEKLGVEDWMSPCSLLGLEAKFNLSELNDVVKYLLDTFYSLQTFLSIFPKACETFHDKGFELRLSAFYERIMARLTELLSPDEADTEEEVLIRHELKATMGDVRLSILSVFREVLIRVCLPRNDDKDYTKPTLSRRIESFVHIFTTAVEEKIFITDYSTTFDIVKDINVFQEEGADMTTLNFVKEAVDSIVKEMSSEAEEMEEETKQKDKVHGDDTSGMNGYYAGETCTLSAIEIESLASMVQDLFPELGCGFIKECLKYYNYSSEEVLNAILEGNLPECLDTLDRTMKEPLPEVFKDPKDTDLLPKKSLNNSRENLTEALEESSVLVNRLNIYDDDEFDVFRKPSSQLKMTQIHRGKVDRNVYEKDAVLSEKVKKIIHEYEWNQGYSIYDDEEKYTAIASTEYDDEYDDTYADNEAGDVDTFEGDTKRFDRMPTIRGRGALNTPAMNFGDEDEGEEGEEEVNGDGVERRLGGAREGPEGSRTSQDIRETRDRRPEHFKKANASQRRSYGDRDQDWDFSSTVSFKSSNRGGNSRRNYNSNAFAGDPNSRAFGDPHSRSFGDPHSRAFGDPHSRAFGDQHSKPIGDPNSRPGDDQNSRIMEHPMERESYPPRSSFVPFCDNPEEVRQRMERKRQNKQFKNKGFVQQPSNSTDDSCSNSSASASASTYQRTSTKTNKHSGKSWRQGPADGDDGEGRKPQGGKFKEDTNHGKTQDRNYRYKMTHKNEQKRSAAQAKYRNNF